jgi:hypothetical protein
VKTKIQLINPDFYYTNPIISNSGLGSFKSKLIGTQGMKAGFATLLFGQLMHMAIYEPEEYNKAEKMPSDKLTRQCERMAEAARKTPVLAGFLKDKRTVYEKPYYAIINGVPVKVKPDALLGKIGHDAKSTACRTFDEFISKFVEYGYWRQAALYMDATGGRNWLFTGITKSEPHKTFLVDCSKFKAEVKAGRIEYLELLRLYVQYHPDYLKKAFEYLKLNT